MAKLTVDQVTPEPQDIEFAHEALPHIKAYLARHHEEVVRLVVDDQEDDEVLEVPRGAVELLARILTHMAAGEGVSIVPSNAELTTQQAANMDFPKRALDCWNIAAKDADSFVLDQIYLNKLAVYSAVRQIANSRRNPPQTDEDILISLER